MSVPPFNAWLLPLLKRLGDGEARPLSSLAQQLADDLSLSPEDRAQMLTSGQLTYQNRVGWARTYLKKAGLIEAPSRGTARITDRGRGVLAENLPAIDVKYLYRFPEFVEFHTPATEQNSVAPVPDLATLESPEDTLERVSLQLRQNLATELLDRIKAAPPDQFERRKGVLITTSSFSAEARAYVRQIEKKIVLLDGNELADLMIEHNLAVSVDATYVVKKLDNDYFET